MDSHRYRPHMQGEQVEESVISALNTINSHLDDFDCVVIIRGGGAVADLSGFDTLALAENVANFPLPVITGIGHERDESILDMISHTRVKTPTAAAAFLISHLKEVLDRLQEAQDFIVNKVQSVMLVEKSRLARLSTQLPVMFSLVKTRQEAAINLFYQRIVGKIQRHIETENNKCSMFRMKCTASVESRMLREQHRLEMLGQRVDASNPERLLKRGYSITYYRGKCVRDASSLQPGDVIETRLEKGTVKSVVKAFDEPLGQ